MNIAHSYSPGLVAEMTHWPEVSEKVKEVQTAVAKCRLFTRSKIFKRSFTPKNLSYPRHFAALVQTAVVDLKQRLAQPIGFVSA